MSDISRSLLIITSVLLYGTIGFTFFEGISPFKALFWTIMTISTVGYYGDITPVSTGGFIIAATSVIGGLGTLLYIVQNVLAGPMLEVKLKEVLGMGIEIKKGISGHTIITGYGDIGDGVAEQLDAIKEEFVVVEQNPKRIKNIEEKGFKFFRGAIQGDASSETILKKLYIEKAKNLILTSKDDANNVFITLSAKAMNRDLRVVTTASESRAIKKLYSAGADEVISSPEIGGMLLANATIRPSVVQFLQDAMTTLDVGKVEIDTVKIPTTSKFNGSSLGSCSCKDLTGALLVGISRGLEVIPNPPNEFTIREGDEIILMGNKEEIKRAHELFGK
jgi:voltage-gated potassium channel